DGERLGGVDRRVAVGESGDHHPEPDPGGGACPGRHGGHRLEALPRPFAVHGLEVVEPPDAVEAEFLGELDPGHVLVPGHSLLSYVETKAHVSCLPDLLPLRTTERTRPIASPCPPTDRAR